MVKFTIEQIRELMNFKHNIRNMSGALPPNTFYWHSDQSSCLPATLGSADA